MTVEEVLALFKNINELILQHHVRILPACSVKLHVHLKLAEATTPSLLFTPTMHLDLITLIVPSYDTAIHFFVTILGFDLASDTPSTTTAGKPKRWVVVRPPGGTTGILLAQADGPTQEAAVGEQFAGRVGLFLQVDDFQLQYERMNEHGVEFLGSPRDEPYGRVVVFRDFLGNRWDLLGPVPTVE